MKIFIALVLCAALTAGAPGGVPQQPRTVVQHQPRSDSDEDYSSEDDVPFSYEEYYDYSEEDYESDRSASDEDYSSEDDLPFSDEYYYDFSEEDYESARSEPIDVATLITPNGRSMKKDKPAKQFAPLQCGTVDTLNYGEYAVIETPGYGWGRYPNNYDCSWTLSIPASSQIYFSCDFFHVRKGDYLFIEDQSYYGYAAEGFGFAAESPDTTVDLNLRFTSNARRRGYGFRYLY